MSRRPSLPGASEFFRPTSPLPANSSTGSEALRAVPALPAEDDHGPRAQAGPAERAEVAEQPGRAEQVGQAGRSERAGPSGRQSHDEKITVYVSGPELMQLEQARLTLRGSHALAVDRGRIVREALAVVLADLDSHGAQSILVRRLREG